MLCVTCFKKCYLGLFTWSHWFSWFCSNARVDCQWNQVHCLSSCYLKKGHTDRLALNFSTCNCAGFKMLSSGKGWSPICQWEVQTRAHFSSYNWLISISRSAEWKLAEELCFGSFWYQQGFGNDMNCWIFCVFGCAQHNSGILLWLKYYV